MKKIKRIGRLVDILLKKHHIVMADDIKNTYTEFFINLCGNYMITRVPNKHNQGIFFAIIDGFFYYLTKRDSNQFRDLWDDFNNRLYNTNVNCVQVHFISAITHYLIFTKGITNSDVSFIRENLDKGVKIEELYYELCKDKPYKDEYILKCNCNNKKTSKTETDYKLVIKEFVFGFFYLIGQVIFDIVRFVVNIVREALYLLTGSYKKYNYDNISYISLFTAGYSNCFEINLNKDEIKMKDETIEIFDLNKENSLSIIEILRKNNVFKYKYDFHFRPLFSKLYLEDTFHAFSIYDGGFNETNVKIVFSNGKEFKTTIYDSKVYDYYFETYEYCIDMLGNHYIEVDKMELPIITVSFR
ncbi:MAG: hypothetical protein IJ880_06475 [Bacilli bacterium]|nr:hypothetical protein [Bacilli bacterium]